ncbi:site-specific recombinase XerD [Burkholderiales bacterium JOSHI_001]|nr:site-specific recombinase XerD [Burkholderiales bacterium JOSHI_001]
MAQVIDFTIRSIEALPAPEKGRSEYRDARTAGLYLRVTSSGVRSFSFVGRAKGSGRVERVTLGKFPAVKPEEARRRATMLLGDLAAGVSAADAARGKREGLTLRAVAALYFESLARRGAKGDTGRTIWALHVDAALGARKMSEITALDLERWHRGLPERIVRHANEARAERARLQAERRAAVAAAQAIRRRGPDPKPRDAAPGRKVTGERTANMALALVRTIYRWASDGTRGYFTGVNPATGHTLFPEVQRERFLQPHELAPFFAALASEPSETVRDFVLVALLTGARRANVVAMRWADVDLEHSTWRIAGSLMKNGQPQTVTLAPEAVTILKARKDASKSAFVFPSELSESGHMEDPRKGWLRILRASKLQDLRLHDLRRTLGSWQARTGASLLTIAKSLNHKDMASTLIYARLDLDPVRQSVDRATSAIFEAAGLKQSAEVTPFPAVAVGAEPKGKRRGAGAR